MDRLSEYVIKHSSCAMPRCEYVENGIEIECDKCQEIMMQEHDTKIRLDAIDECMRAIVNTESKVVNPCASKTWDELILLANRQFEILEILEQLKEQKNDK